MPNKPTYEELEQRVKQLEKESDKHKHAEEALREFETKFLTVFRSNPSGMVITKLVTGECIDLNESFSSITGYAREEAIGRTSIEIGFWIEPGDREKVTQQIKYQNGFRELEFNFRSKTGEIRSGLFSTEIVNIKGEQCIITTLNDITKRKRAEKALKESEGRFRRLSEAAEEGVVIHERGMILECNEALARMLRSTVSEVIGTHVPQYMTTESWEKVRQYITSGYDKPYEITAIRMDGTPFPCEVTGKSYEFEGNILRVGALRDITERKQAEEEKRKALEFAAEQSKHALIGQVAGKMAHDFNNILMGIMGNSQLAIMDCDNKEIKKQLENIMEFSERGSVITNHLLSFSKDQEPKQTYFRIEDKIDLVLKMLGKDLSRINVSRNYKSGIPELLADPGMIQDVIFNIIQNSIHAMCKVENPTLNISAYSQDDQVYFEVEDNGCGIPKEHQDSIYIPSFTLKGGHDRNGSYKTGIRGTGYGMSNVKKYVVEKHKGDIFFESKEGIGTKITIAFRITKDYLSSNEKEKISESQVYDKRRILLVEDEPAIADVQYQILTKDPFNHVVTIAVNGQIAIDLFNRNKFDAVSLDYMLPGNINGLDVYNHIRKNDKKIPVMFISGNIEFLESMKKLKEKDPNLKHMSKPVNMLDYVNMINKTIGSRI